MMMKLNCMLVGNARDPFSVNVIVGTDSGSVEDLKDAIKEKKKNDLEKIDADNLMLYLAKRDGTWLNSDGAKAVTRGDLSTNFVKMNPLLRLDEDEYYGKNFTPGKGDIHVLVELPESATVSTIGIKRSFDFAFKALDIEPKEYDLDNWKKNENTIVKTPMMSEFFKGVGEFPEKYFVRLEEIKLWEAIKTPLDEEMLSEGEMQNSFVIVGSPGVGKSTFSMLVAFYIVKHYQRPVFIVRKLKSKNRPIVFIILKRDGTAVKGRVKIENASDVRDQFLAENGLELQDIFTLLDGFSDADVNRVGPTLDLRPFNFLATSCQYDKKSDDILVKLFVLPAWRLQELKMYATMTEWANKRIIAEVNDVEQLVHDQYLYSGGGLREFCLKRKDLENLVGRYIASVGPHLENFLMGTFGSTHSSQVDRIRRHFVEDRENVKQYETPLDWRLVVDSQWMLKQLMERVTLEDYRALYAFAKNIGGSLHGLTYELCVHKLMTQREKSSVALQPFAANEADFENPFVTMTVQSPKVVCYGKNLSEAWKYVKEVLPTKMKVGEVTYWYPEYNNFPAIDAIALCQCKHKDSQVNEEVLVYLQITMAKTKPLNSSRMIELKEIFSGYSNQILVVLTPSAEICDTMGLNKDTNFPKATNCYQQTSDFSV